MRFVFLLALVIVTACSLPEKSPCVVSASGGLTVSPDCTFELIVDENIA